MAYDATSEYKKQFQTKEYYQGQYEKYKSLNKIEEASKYISLFPDNIRVKLEN